MALILLPFLILSSFSAAAVGNISPTSGLEYEPLGNVTYGIELTVQVRNKHPATTAVLDFYMPHWKNWSVEEQGIDSSLQQSFMKSATPEGYNVAIFNQTDQFNNSYDYYQKSLLPAGGKFVLSMNFSLTTQQVRWTNLGVHDLSEYDTGSYFYHMYTQDQPDFIKVSDPNIQGNASQICGAETNPVEIARKIYDWVSQNIDYQLQTGTGTGEKGASWALANRQGDCSEYSDLMVALLRARGVPARKVVGIALIDEDGQNLPNYAVGSSWYYMKDLDSSFNNITGHAWMEYYVPGHGWISCDPTWGVGRTDDLYFNFQDHLHVGAARGEYFGDEVSPIISPEIGEYQAVPYLKISFVLLDNIYYNTRIVVTVIDNHMWVDATLLIWVVGILIVISVIAIIYWAASGRRNK